MSSYLPTTNFSKGPRLSFISKDVVHVPMFGNIIRFYIISKDVVHVPMFGNIIRFYIVQKIWKTQHGPRLKQALHHKQNMFK